LSPAYLRRAHNRCLSCINGPFPNTAGARHPHSRATQVSLTLPLTRSPAAASHTTGSSPRTPIQSGGLYGGAVTRGSISRTHCHAPPESGLFLGRKAPYPSFIPNPSAAFPTGLDRRSPVSRPVLGGRDRRRERALWFLFTISRSAFEVHPVRGGGSTPPGRRAEQGHPSALATHRGPGVSLSPARNGHGSAPDSASGPASLEVQARDAFRIIMPVVTLVVSPMKKQYGPIVH
jgi:hypothetical protein